MKSKDPTLRITATVIDITMGTPMRLITEFVQFNPLEPSAERE